MPALTRMAREVFGTHQIKLASKFVPIGEVSFASLIMETA